VSGFLPIKPSVILITGRLDPAATLLRRAILGARYLGGIVARPAGTKSVPEPTVSVSLLRSGPDASGGRLVEHAVNHLDQWRLRQYVVEISDECLFDAMPLRRLGKIHKTPLFAVGFG
jgi:hypothetical protein